MKTLVLAVLMLLPVFPVAPASAGFAEESYVQEASFWNSVFSWGNYCGAGRNGKGYLQKPVDNVDAACRRHDRCLVRSGHADGSASCPCERSFYDELNAMIESDESLSFAARNFARGARLWTDGRVRASCR